MKTKLVYISGGEKFAPSEVQSALDEIRRGLNLPADVMLVGMPVESKDPDSSVDAPAPAHEHKILQFPKVKKASILNVLGAVTDEEGATPATIELSDVPLVVDDTDDDVVVSEEEASITALFDGLPSMSEDAPIEPARPMVKEFGEFLDKEPQAEPEAIVTKKARPFGRKTKGKFNNVLGDLFSFAGIAANDDDEDFKLPDFIRRP